MRETKKRKDEKERKQLKYCHQWRKHPRPICISSGFLSIEVSASMMNNFYSYLINGAKEMFFQTQKLVKYSYSSTDYVNAKLTFC